MYHPVTHPHTYTHTHIISLSPSLSLSLSLTYTRVPSLHVQSSCTQENNTLTLYHTHRAHFTSEAAQLVHTYHPATIPYCGATLKYSVHCQFVTKKQHYGSWKATKPILSQQLEIIQSIRIHASIYNSPSPAFEWTAPTITGNLRAESRLQGGAA